MAGGVPAPPHAQPAVVASQQEALQTIPLNDEFCQLGCVTNVMGATLIYATFMALAALTACYVKPPLVGLLLLSLLPAVFLLSYLQRTYHKCVLKREMVATFFRAIIYMLPIVAVELMVGVMFTKAGLADPTAQAQQPTAEGGGAEQPLGQHLSLMKMLVSSFLQSYFVAGLWEEMIKYCAVKRIFTQRFVVDPRALLVYAACAGAAFGTVEDLEYVLGAGHEGKVVGIATGVFRAFVAVPLHIGTAILIGASLARTRFINGDVSQQRWYKTILLPVLAHGSYDFLCMAFGELGLILALLILVAVYVHIRRCLLQLQRAYPEEGNVREKIAKGEVVPMSCLSLTCVIVAALASLVAIVVVQALIASLLVTEPK